MKLSPGTLRSMKPICRPFGWFTLGLLTCALIQVTACDREEQSHPSREQLSEPTKVEAPRAEPETNQVRSEAGEALALDGPEGAAKSAAELVERSHGSFQANSKAELQVRRLVLAADVKEREPIALETPRTKQPVVAFLELANESNESTRVRVTFIHQSGLKVGMIDLDVPARTPRYRTWGRTRNITRPGEWAMVVQSASGTELQRRRFYVTG